MNKEVEKEFKKYEHLRVKEGDITSDAWIYRKGNKEAILTYEMRIQDIAQCFQLLEYLNKQ